MPLPEPVEVEDGTEVVKLSDMVTLQTRFNEVLSWLKGHETTIDGLGQLVTEQFVRDIVQEHANKDTEIHGSESPEQRILKSANGAGFVFADRNETEVPVGVYDGDIRIAPPA